MYKEDGLSLPKSSVSLLKSYNATELELKKINVSSAGEWKVQLLDYMCYFWRVLCLIT